MRRQSKKTAARERECREFRRALVAEVGRCELCGHMGWVVPSTSAHKRGLCCHEIARGIHRQKALDQRCAILVVCPICHDELDGWPEERQLAVLKRSRPANVDLAAYNALIGWGESRITAADVDAWDRKPGLTDGG